MSYQDRDTVKEFLAERSTRISREGYRLALSWFARSCSGVKDAFALDDYVNSAKEGKRDVREDVYTYYLSIKELAPKSVQFRIAVVRSFLDFKEIELPKRFWRSLRKRKNSAVKAITMDRPPTPGELKKIVQHMPIHGKAAALCLASGGLRLGELLQIRIADMDFGHDPPMVKLKAGITKTGQSRIAFISSEAAEAVKDWLKNRDSYCKTAKGRSWRYLREASGLDLRVFPFTDSVMYWMWEGALRKAGFDERDAQTKILVRHVHTLRKYFKTELTKAIRNPEIAEALMGHEGGIAAVYSRYTLEDVAKLYKEGEPALTVFTNQAEVLKLQEEVAEGKKMTVELLGEQRDRIKALEAKAAEVDDLKRILTDIAKRVQL